MLRSLKSIFGYIIQAQDGQVGNVSDVFFDNERWIIRYLVVNTGSILLRKNVLLSPIAFTPPETKPDWGSKTIDVFLTKKQVEEAPDADADKPVSRQKEIEMSQYYEWPRYWEHDFFAVPRTPYTDPDINVQRSEGDPNVRSAKEIFGYSIHGLDGNIGHADDFIIDDQTWNIVYLVVDTRNILPGKKVLVALQWIKSISWSRSQIDIELSRESIRSGPEYNPDEPVNREIEDVLYDFYGRPKYWAE